MPYRVYQETLARHRGQVLGPSDPAIRETLGPRLPDVDMRFMDKLPK